MTEEDISERESTARKNDEDSPIISSTQKKRVKFNDEWWSLFINYNYFIDLLV